MAISYEQRDQQRIVRLAIDGPFDAAEAAGMLDRLDVEGRIAYGILWDLRRMTASPTTDELWSFSRDYAHQRADSADPRGPIAIVTNDDGMYERACLYVVMAQPRLEADVFRQIDEAEKWLTDKVSGPLSR
jgi:hypothetical protein